MTLETIACDGVGPVAWKTLPLKMNISKMVGALIDKTAAGVKTETSAGYSHFTDNPPPAGYETAIGFVATRNPESLDFLEDPIAAVSAEHEALFELCMKKGLPVVETTAPSALRERGIKRTYAFPLEILEAHLL